MTVTFCCTRNEHNVGMNGELGDSDLHTVLWDFVFMKWGIESTLDMKGCGCGAFDIIHKHVEKTQPNNMSLISVEHLLVTGS